MKTDTETLVPLDFVYMGLVVLADGKSVGDRLGVVIDGKITREAIYACERGGTRFYVGNVYRGAHFSETKGRGIKSAKFVSRWLNTDDVTGWEAESTAADVVVTAIKLNAKAGAVSEIETVMLPLRRKYAAYARMYNVAGMEAYERAVLRALRHTPRKTERDPT